MSHESMIAPPNSVRFWLRLEGLAVLGASVVAYYQLEGSWLLFGLLFLVPDLSMLAYLIGPRSGAVAYNLMHTYVGPIALGVSGVASSAPILMTIALIWSAHIGFDRVLGYGLKHPTGFHYTHLGVIGRRETEETAT